MSVWPNLPPRRAWIPRLLGLSGVGLALCLGSMLASSNPPARAQSPKPQNAKPAAAQPAQTAEDLRKVEAARDAALKRLHELEQAGATAEREAADIDADLLAAASDVEARETAADATETRLHALEDQALEARARLSADAGTSEDVLAALITLSSRRPPALAASPDDAGRAIRAALLMGDAAPALASRAEDLRQRVVKLDAAAAGVLHEREVLAGEETALGARRQEIEALAAEKRHTRASLAAETASLKAETDSLARQAEDLRDLMDRLAKAAAARPAPKAAGKTPGQSSGKKTGGKVATKPPGKSTASATKPAPAASGPLARAEAASKALTPAIGVILRRFGQTVDGARSQGLTFSTRAGAQVVAPRAAHIQYAGLFRSYGNMLILDVGEDYLVVVSGLDALYPEAGQEVLAGEPIGRMADRTLPAPELYLEVRKGGQPVDPEGWLAKGR